MQINFKKIKPKFIFLFCYLFLIFFNFNYLYKTSHVKILSPDVHFVPKDIDTFRKDFNEIIGFYETNKKFLNEKSLLLTNDIQIQLWWIFLDNKYFYFPYVFFVSLSDDMIETQLINAFKYFSQNKRRCQVVHLVFEGGHGKGNQFSLFRGSGTGGDPSGSLRTSPVRSLLYQHPFGYGCRDH
mgnify:CR=1 FL=1